MRLLLTLSLLLICGAFCLAQDRSAVGSGLIVVKSKWHQNLRGPALDTDPNGDAAERQAGDPIGRPSVQVLDPSETERKPIRQVLDADIRDTEVDDTSRPDRLSAYIYEVWLRNDGEKDVSSVTWEYIFFAPETGQEVGRRRFTTKTALPHGKTRTLTVRSAIPPTGTIDVSKTGSKTREHYNEKVVVLSVEYSDGSKWASQ